MVPPGSSMSRLLVTTPLACSYAKGYRSPFFVSLDHKYNANIRAVSAKIWHWTNYFLFFYKYFFLPFQQQTTLIK
jgi:hypothetical protein